MAENSNIARPYAKAAFSYAVETKTIANWHAFLTLAATVVSEPQIKPLMKNPRVTSEQIINLIISIATNTVTEQQHNFLKVVSHFHRLNILPAIANEFETLHKEMDKTVTAKIISAFPISTVQQQNLIQALKIRLQKDIAPEYEIDADLIGGVVIRAGDFVMDDSVRSKLERMRLMLVE
jgi:F-type H+-transporting ATPase subunit delta